MLNPQSFGREVQGGKEVVCGLEESYCNPAEVLDPVALAEECMVDGPNHAHPKRHSGRLQLTQLNPVYQAPISSRMESPGK
jgi:hypothetical protein